MAKFDRHLTNHEASVVIGLAGNTVLIYLLKDVQLLSKPISLEPPVNGAQATVLVWNWPVLNKTLSTFTIFPSTEV